MPNKRAEGKHQHTFWCTDEEWENLKAYAAGFEMNVTEMILAIARYELDVYKPED